MSLSSAVVWQTMVPQGWLGNNSVESAAQDFLVIPPEKSHLDGKYIPGNLNKLNIFHIFKLFIPAKVSAKAPRKVTKDWNRVDLP